MRNRGMKYKKCLPRKYSGGSAELAAAAMAENENKTIEKIAAEKAAILCFELWQDMIVSGNIPKAERYKKEFMTFYGEKAANSELYYMFLGFIGGTDFIKATEKK